MSHHKPSKGAFTFILLIILMVMLNACAGLRHNKDSIKVNLSSLKMLPSTVFEQRFEADIRIQNRSQSTLDINGLSFDLALNDKDFASGVSNQKMALAPLSEGVMTINLTSTLFSLIRQFHSMQELHDKPFSYNLQGKIFSDSDIFGVSFSEKGEIDLTAPGGKE